VKLLHGARREFAAADAEYRAAWDAHDKAFQEANAELIERRTAAAATAGMLETSVRDHAKVIYAARQDKHPCPGVNIACGTTYNYPEVTAYDWAIAHEQCLTLDKKAFADVCKSDKLRPWFVTPEESVSVRIDTDLTKALQAGARDDSDDSHQMRKDGGFVGEPEEN
jgi:uncharacterized protein (DUF4415 family)